MSQLGHFKRLSSSTYIINWIISILEVFINRYIVPSQNFNDINSELNQCILSISSNLHINIKLLEWNITGVILWGRDWRYAVSVPYRTVLSRTETRRYGKKRSRAVRYGTVLFCCGTVRYAVLDSYTALPRNIYTESLEQNVLYSLLFMSEVCLYSLFLNIEGIEMYQIIYS